MAVFGLVLQKVFRGECYTYVWLDVGVAAGPFWYMCFSVYMSLIYAPYYIKIYYIIISRFIILKIYYI